MKKIAIIQSNYIPWKGYFDIINIVDIFVIGDDVQYTKQDWRNRNKIKTLTGVKYITIPVIYNSTKQKIIETKIANKNWNKKHWNLIKESYRKASFFNEYKDIFEELYLNSNEEYLSEINYKFIKSINKLLGINTKIVWSNELKIEKDRNERLISFCKQLKADVYLSGPSAKNYLDEKLFEKEGIKVEWMDYSGYPEYPQLYPPFVHEVSIIDLIFNTGKNAFRYMKSFRKKDIE